MRVLVDLCVLESKIIAFIIRSDSDGVIAVEIALDFRTLDSINETLHEVTAPSRIIWERPDLLAVAAIHKTCRT